MGMMPTHGARFPGLSAVGLSASSLAAGLATATLDFTNGLTGGVARTSKARGSDAVSVKDFGAVGDGTTNDSPAFQAAVDSGARRVIVPGGTYLLSTMVTIANGKELTIEGGGYNYVGQVGTTIKVPAGNIGIKVLCHHFGMSNTLFSGIGAGGDAVGGVGLWLGAINKPILHNVFFTGFTFTGLVLDTTQNCTFSSVGAQYNVLAVFITNQTRHATFIGLQIGNASGGPAAIAASSPANRGVFIGRFAYDASGATSINKYIPQLADTSSLNYPSEIEFKGGLSERYGNDAANIEINGFYGRVTFDQFELCDALATTGFLVKTGQVHASAVGEVVLREPKFVTNQAAGSRPQYFSAHDRGQVFVEGRPWFGWFLPIYGKNVFWGYVGGDRPPYHSALSAPPAFKDGIGSWVTQGGSTTVTYDGTNRLMTASFVGAINGIQCNAIALYNTVTGSDWTTRAGTACRVEGNVTALTAGTSLLVYLLDTLTPFQTLVGTISRTGRFRFDVELTATQTAGVRVIASGTTTASFSEFFVGLALDQSHGAPSLPRPFQHEATVGPRASLTKTANYTLAASDAGAQDQATGTWTLTVPAASTLGDNFSYTLVNSGAGTITLDGPGATNATLAAGYAATVVTANGGVFVASGAVVTVS